MEEQVWPMIRKKLLLVSVTLMMAMLFYFLLPFFLFIIPEKINEPSFIFGIPWAWLYALSQLPMTWLFGCFYHLLANHLERKIREMSEKC